MSEADTCRKYIVPKLYAAGWDDDHIREQVYITDGRILPLGKKQFKRKEGLKPDYILDYRRFHPIAVVEAKAEYRKPDAGMQQAIEYAQMLDVKFTYSSNGLGIVEHDLLSEHGNLLEIAALFGGPQEMKAAIDQMKQLLYQE